jgi:hypothetical protein
MSFSLVRAGRTMLAKMPPSSWVPVAHAYNPRYSGGRDQEDHSLKPAQANSLEDPISKNPITKIGLVEWLKVKVLSSTPSMGKKKKECLQAGVRCITSGIRTPGCPIHCQRG